MPTTNYTPGQSFPEFLVANGYAGQNLTTNDIIRLQKAYSESKRAHETYGLPGAGSDPYDYISRNEDDTSGPRADLEALYERYSDPNYGFGYFSRLAADAAPTSADFLARVRALGGSAAQAQEQFEAARRQGTSQAFGAFGQFRQGVEGNLTRIPALLLQDDLSREQLELERERLEAGIDQERKRRRDDWLQAGLNLLGYGFGALWNGGGSPPPGSYGGYGGYGSFPNPYGGYSGGFTTPPGSIGVEPSFRMTSPPAGADSFGTYEEPFNAFGLSALRRMNPLQRQYGTLGSSYGGLQGAGYR